MFVFINILRRNMKANFRIHNLYKLIIPAFVLSHANINIFSGNKVVYFIYILFLLLSIVNNSYALTVKSTLKPYYVVILVTLILLPSICGNIVSIKGLAYSLLLVIFMFSIGEFINKIIDSKEYNSFLCFWVVSIQALLLLYVGMNLQEINSETIRAFAYDSTSNLERIRATFGLGHPNSAALILVTAILLCYAFFLETDSIKTKVILALNIVIDLVALLCTGSRTGVLSLVIFILAEILVRIIQKVERYRKIIFVLVLIGCFIVLSTINYTGLLQQTSGRSDVIKESMEKLTSLKVLLFGYEVANISNSRDVFNTNSFLGTDNWYYMWLIRFGLVGVVGFVSVIFASCLRVYKSIVSNVEVYSYPLSMIICLLIYGMGENCVFNQGVIISFVVLVVFLRADIVARITLEEGPT